MSGGRCIGAWSVCLSVLLMATCGREPRSPADAPSTFTVLVPVDWTPRISRDLFTKFVTFLPLATPNERGELVGRLARSWEHSADYRRWTIHLRTDVRWHDGVPVTAADIEFTVNLWNHPDVVYPGNPYEAVEVIDDSTVVLTYRSGTMWRTYWYPGYDTVFYPKHLLEDLDPAAFEEWDFWSRPVGNGPFRYVRHTPHTSVEFEANPDFYLGRPAIDRVVMRLTSASITELLAGNVDAMNLEQRSAVEAIVDDPRFKIYYEAWDDIGSLVALQYNQRNPRFRDASVRRAIAHAINRRELRRVLHSWDSLPLVDVPFTEAQYWRGDLPEPLAYDTVLAKRLLADAGWRDNNGDNVLERAGHDFRVPMIVPDRYQPGAVYVQQQLARLGIQIEITTLEGRALAARTRAGDFDLAMSGVTVNPDDPDQGLEILLGRNSRLNYDNPEVVALIDMALAATTPEALDTAYARLAPIIQTDQPFTFLTFGTEMNIAHRRIRGLRSPFMANPLTQLDRLWIEESR